MRIVIDTNIAFSAILNTNSKISRIILQPRSGLNFYSTRQLQDEIAENWPKLKSISNFNDIHLQMAYSLIIQKIRFINIELVPISILKKAELLTCDVDIDDTEFVALTEHIKGKLWTGDKELKEGLIKNKWTKLISTDELYHYIFNK